MPLAAAQVLGITIFTFMRTSFYLHASIADDDHCRWTTGNHICT